MTHSRTHDTHEHDTYTDSLIARQQIRLNAVLSQQIQAEEHKHLAEHIKQIENKRSPAYQQTTKDPPLLNRHTDNQRPENYDNEEMFENPNPTLTGFFQGQANLNIGRVTGYYYNACIKVAFKSSKSKFRK